VGRRHKNLCCLFPTWGVRCMWVWARCRDRAATPPQAWTSLRTAMVQMELPTYRSCLIYVLLNQIIFLSLSPITSSFAGSTTCGLERVDYLCTVDASQGIQHACSILERTARNFSVGVINLVWATVGAGAVGER
jgi:hypothetical protein